MATNYTQRLGNTGTSYVPSGANPTGTPLDQIPANILSGSGAGSFQPSGAGFTLNSDPGVINALALENQGLGQLDAGLKSARERAIINFGDPALAEQAGFGLDPQAGAFAQQNYLSGNATLARLDKQHQLARQAVINQLASRGLLQSGDLGYQEGQADQAYGNNVYDAKNAVLDQLANLFSNYLGSRTNLTSQTQSARLAAIQNFLSNPDAYASAFGGGSPAQATQTQTATTNAPAKKKVTSQYVNGGASTAVARAILAASRAA